MTEAEREMLTVLAVYGWPVLPVLADSRHAEQVVY